MWCIGMANLPRMCSATGAYDVPDLHCDVYNIKRKATTLVHLGIKMSWLGLGKMLRVLSK